MPEIRVTSSKDLQRIIRLVHDLYLDADDLSAQSGTRRVLKLWRNARSKTPVAALVVNNVDLVKITDTERVGRYDINEIHFAEPNLTLTTGIPIGIQITVQNLDLVFYNDSDIHHLNDLERGR